MGESGSCMGLPGWPLTGPFNHFAIFESANFENATKFYPCPDDDPVCADGHRTGKGANETIIMEIPILTSCYYDIV